MTQEDKELLLKDLCARLPYRVKGNFQNSDDELLRSITIMYRYLEPNGMVMTGDIKPYLFPLSRISEEIIDEIYNNAGVYDICVDSSVHIEVGTKFEDLSKVFDILHKHHIDYRGLISKGLAIDATELNIY